MGLGIGIRDCALGLMIRNSKNIVCFPCFFTPKILGIGTLKTPVFKKVYLTTGSLSKSDPPSLLESSKETRKNDISKTKVISHYIQLKNVLHFAFSETEISDFHQE